jgi:uncharacterized repeat protein (TIGR03809 family)
MQALPGRPGFDQITKKWHDLAERRLAHYTELYRSGRWQHYYTQELFATRMLDVINVAKKWRALAAGSQNAGQAEQTPRRDDKMRPAA